MTDVFLCMTIFSKRMVVSGVDANASDAFCFSAGACALTLANSRHRRLSLRENGHRGADTHHPCRTRSRRHHTARTRQIAANGSPARRRMQTMHSRCSSASRGLGLCALLRDDASRLPPSSPRTSVVGVRRGTRRRSGTRASLALGTRQERLSRSRATRTQCDHAVASFSPARRRERQCADKTGLCDRASHRRAYTLHSTRSAAIGSRAAASASSRMRSLRRVNVLQARGCASVRTRAANDALLATPETRVRIMSSGKTSRTRVCASFSVGTFSAASSASCAPPARWRGHRRLDRVCCRSYRSLLIPSKAPPSSAVCLLGHDHASGT